MSPGGGTTGPTGKVAGGTSTSSRSHISRNRWLRRPRLASNGPSRPGSCNHCTRASDGTCGHMQSPTNTGSNTVTGYTEATNGTLTLLDADGVTATTDAGPIDLAGTADGRFLYELNGKAGTAGIYAVASDGGLTRTGTVTGLPVNSAAAPGMQGIVVT